jgi:hypothetical protein
VVRIRSISGIQYNPHLIIIRSDPNPLQKYDKGYDKNNIRTIPTDRQRKEKKRKITELFSWYQWSANHLMGPACQYCERGRAVLPAARNKRAIAFAGNPRYSPRERFFHYCWLNAHLHNLHPPNSQLTISLFSSIVEAMHYTTWTQAWDWLWLDYAWDLGNVKSGWVGSCQKLWCISFPGRHAGTPTVLHSYLLLEV